LNKYSRRRSTQPARNDYVEWKARTEGATYLTQLIKPTLLVQGYIRPHTHTHTHTHTQTASNCTSRSVQVNQIPTYNETKTCDTANEIINSQKYNTIRRCDQWSTQDFILGV